MVAMAPAERPVLFHYPASIYSHRVLWYLWLHEIPYDECIQPAYMPRPDLATLDVNYRRIPVMSIGQDIYCDSRLIISKLKRLYPDKAITQSSPFEAGIRKLLESWTIDGGIFANCVKLIPYWLSPSFLEDENFLDDRQKLMGGWRMTADALREHRPEGLQHLRQALEVMETTFFIDDRKWILGGEEPSDADIDGIWPFYWLITDPHMTGSLPEEFASEKIFPKTFAWVHRFKEEVTRRRPQMPKPTELDGNTTSSRVLNSSAPTEPTTFLPNDPLQLNPGDKVQVYPSDYGSTHKDTGNIVGLSLSEVVIRNAKGLHLHFPRWNFAIKAISPQPIAPNPSPLRPQIPSMRLIYHPASPFSRKVYIHALELGLAPRIGLQKVVVCPIPFPGWSDNNNEVAEVNPMAKIPCLVSDNVPGGLYDSRVICEYLSSLMPATTAGTSQAETSQHWQMRALHACADDIMDAAVLITYETRIRKPKGLFFEEWVEGQRVKILRGLDHFEDAFKEGVLAERKEGRATMDEVAVAVAITTAEGMKFLGVDWREGRNGLTQWMKWWEIRESFTETAPGSTWGGESAEDVLAKI